MNDKDLKFAQNHLRILSGLYGVLMTYAKNARGQMANYIIKNQITNPELIRSFEGNGYIFDSSSSDENNWVFLRG